MLLIVWILFQIGIGVDGGLRDREQDTNSRRWAYATASSSSCRYQTGSCPVGDVPPGNSQASSSSMAAVLYGVGVARVDHHIVLYIAIFVLRILLQVCPCDRGLGRALFEVAGP